MEITEYPLIPDQDLEPEAYRLEEPYAMSVYPIPSSNPTTPATDHVLGQSSIS